MGRNDLGRKCDPTYYADGMTTRSRCRYVRLLKKRATRVRRRSGKRAIAEQLPLPEKTEAMYAGCRGGAVCVIVLN